MQVYKTKIKRLSGSNAHEVRKSAFGFYERIRKKTKRRPYVRSLYFNKEKVFLSIFWEHLFTKENWRDRTRRLKFFPAGIELIQQTHFEPVSRDNPNRKGEVLHRFAGITKDNYLFYVQIKEDKRKGHKWLMSVFPENDR